MTGGPARRRHLLLVCGLAALAACRADAPRSLSPNAQPEIVEAFRQDLERRRDPSDGGGRVWLEEAPAGGPMRAGESGRWSFHYEAGALGIAAGGALYFQVSPFWGWSTPQTVEPSAPGFVELSTDAPGLELEATTLDRQLLGIRPLGRSLAPGERIRIVYGAGPAGARADRFAERESHFWFAVDGDGDGVRSLLPSSPAIEVVAAAPERLVAHLTATGRPGETVRLTLAALDRYGNAGVELTGEIALDGSDALGLPPTVALRPEDEGRRTVEGAASAPGVYRVGARGPGGLDALSNPLEVSDDAPRVLWGDLHGHSALSDGTGTPGDYYRYAREVAALDVAALTDHDHWGMRALSRHPELWEEIRRETALHHRPGRFVTLLGYEWTSWIHGHRHVLYFEDRGEILSSVDEAYETPLQLWRALAGRPALTFAHHSAGSPVATNWDYAPDPVLEPVTEIASVHGSSEAPDSPTPVAGGVPGNFVRDALDRGYRLGLIGSGDSHDGHPGLAGIAAPSSGLAAILSEEANREGILEALRARRVYATNGPRILLRATLDDRPMGSAAHAPPAGAAPLELAVEVEGTGPVARIDTIRSGRIGDSFDCGGTLACRLRRPVRGIAAGDYLYVRVVQADGGAAWSSPFFFD